MKSAEHVPVNLIPGPLGFDSLVKYFERSDSGVHAKAEETQEPLLSQFLSVQKQTLTEIQSMNAEIQRPSVVSFFH